MKKLIIAFLLLATLLTVGVSAEETAVTQQDSEHRQLLVSLKNGIIPIKPETTYEDFMSYMKIIDESDGKLHTAKVDTLFYLIEYYHYGNLTMDTAFELFKTKTDSVDINNMDETYKLMFSMLDKFSYYLTPDETASFLSPNTSKGIGIRMMWRDATETQPEGVYVEEVAYGSSAEEAGIAIGDRIVEFNGVDMRGLGFDALAAYSTTVPQDSETLTITLDRNGEEKEYVLERGYNTYSEYTLKLYPEKSLIYLDIDSFMNSSTPIYIAQDIDEAWMMGYRNVIIDLQDNSGGDVYIATSIMSKFVPGFQTLFYMGRDGSKKTMPFYSKGDGYSFDNINILVNSGSASSAEIFTDTLRNLVGAKVIGTQTYGKGVAQTVFTFGDGAAVGVTTYVAYDTKGNTYNEVGLKPDVGANGVIEKNRFTETLPYLTVLDLDKAKEGAENARVKGLEMRLEAIGFLASSQVDYSWTDATTRALKAFQKAVGFEETGVLDRETYLAVMDYVRAWENSYYVTYSLFDYAYRFFPRVALTTE